jgi:hypothetical protein
VYKVRVTESYRWTVATVGGRHFTKIVPVEIQDVDMTDEIRTSPILEVVKMPQPDSEAAPAKSRRKGRIHDTSGDGQSNDGRE